MIQRFLNGFDFVLRGRRLIRETPGLKWWALLPFGIDVIIFFGVLYLGLAQVKAWVYQLSLFVLGSPGNSYFEIFYYPLLLLFWLVAFVMCFYLVYVLASVVASPFNSILSEKTLIYLGAKKNEPTGMARLLQNSFKMLLTSLKRAIFLVLIGLALFVFSLIPGLNLLAAYFVFILLAFDSMDYAFEELHYDFRKRLDIFREFFVEFCGMGAFIGLTAVIPGLTLLLMPMAVVGASGLLSELIARPQKFRAKI